MTAVCIMRAGLLQVETKPWQIQLPSRKLELELTTVSSNYHVEMNPSDVGRNDRYVVQEIIKVSFLRMSASAVLFVCMSHHEK